MSGDGLLHLRWNNHHSSFMQVLATLRNKETYSDITLACDGKFYSVHKLVLSTCSDYFVEIMSKTPCKHPIIVLKDIRHEDLEALLNYMYLGEVNVIQSDLASLIKAAECLQIKGLAVPDESTHLEENITKIEADYGIEGKQKKRKVDDVTIDAYNSNKKSSHKTKEQYNSDERDTQHEEENTNVDTAYGENQPKNKTFDNTYIEQQAVPLSMVGEIVIKEEPDLKYEDESSKVTKEDAIGESRCTPQGAELHAESGEQMDFQEQLDVEDRKDSNPAVNQPYSIQPQSFEDIVSQAIPGPSLQIDPGHGWDGAQSKRETSSFHLQGFSEQESVSPHHHRMQPMPLEFTVTERGGRKLLHDGYAYTVDRKRNDITYWQCEERRGCGGRLKTKNDLLHGDPLPHSHPPDASRAAVLKAMQKMKEIASNTKEVPSAIVQNCTLDFPLEASGSLPKRENLLKMIRRHRK